LLARKNIVSHQCHRRNRRQRPRRGRHRPRPHRRHGVHHHHRRHRRPRPRLPSTAVASVTATAASTTATAAPAVTAATAATTGVAVTAGAIIATIYTASVCSTVPEVCGSRARSVPVVRAGPTLTSNVHNVFSPPRVVHERWPPRPDDHVFRDAHGVGRDDKERDVEVARGVERDLDCWYNVP